jgi:hypothetical protein
MLDVLTDSFLVIYKLFQEQTKAHHAEAWKEKQAAMFPFIQHERLEWDAHCNGVHAYHAWVLERTDGGVYVITEETQTGWLARLGALVVPNRMSRWHQRWLEGLGKVAEIQRQPNSGQERRTGNKLVEFEFNDVSTRAGGLDGRLDGTREGS